MVQPNDPIRSFEPLWGDWYADEFLGADGVARAYRLVRRDGGRAVYGACRHIAIPRDEAEAQSLRAKGLDAKAAAAYFEQRVARVRAAIERMNALRNESGVVTYEDHAVVHREGTLQWDILIRTEPLIPLGDYIADNPMEPEEVRRLGVELSRAFEACEAKGIVCRAFGEGDVYLSPQGAFKLGDLCVAGELMDDRTDFRGAPFSMAPEVYGGKPADAAASVYSLGILMYKLLNNNRYPFLPPAPQEISAQAAERALDLRMRGNMPPWPTGGDKALTSVVMKAIGFDPATRFASASEMKAALLARSAVELPEPLPARDATSPPAYAVGEKPLQGFTQSEYAPQPPAGYAYAPAQAHPPYAQSAPGYAQKPAARKKLGVGAIVGIVLGAAVIVTLLAILLVNSIKANKYEQALQLEASGSYKEALSAFSEIADYQESANHIDTLHVKLVDRYLSEGDAESARASLDAVSYEAPTEDQKTELLYNRIRVDFALKSYDAAFTGLTSLYAAPRGTELYEQAISDF
ncbi:MAG TPA: hypothetical protein VN540_04955, partial [Clostridia bacterium]|nr:hypothetical protein [Clostridia bacterium]